MTRHCDSATYRPHQHSFRQRLVTNNASSLSLGRSFPQWVGQRLDLFFADFSTGSGNELRRRLATSWPGRRHRHHGWLTAATAMPRSLS